MNELLSTDAPLADLWPRCCELLCELMQARHAAIELDSEPIAGTAVCREGESVRMTVPITFGRRHFGTIELERAGEYDDEHVTLLESCALSIGAHLYHESTAASSERYAQLAFSDSLTGIGNRRRFDEAFAREWHRGARDSSPISLLMIDLDFFKSFNDGYGHQAGDLCLQRVAHALHDCVRRPADVIARYGGEEFVALLPDTDAKGAIAIAEEMCAAVASLEIVHGGSSLGRISLSIGVASEQPGASSSPDALLQQADGALYRAKLGGRNRIYARDFETKAESARPRRIAAQNNLPVSLTRLVGRQTEVAQVGGLLEKHRLVSIVGTGGTGKTRVAVEAASSAAGRFADGAWFVDLSSISDPTLIASSIASVFSAGVSIDESAADALAVILESRDALLVIDNCEHLIAEVAKLVLPLLRHCHKLSILITSRESLGVAGEAVYRLPLLRMPPPDGELSASEALKFDAVALFVERVTESKSEFVLDDANLGAVLAICRAVDGIALALELAASRVAVIGLQHVAARLQEYPLLTGGDRSGLPRHRTMHAAIGWSYELLSESERTLFRRLSVFAGTFSFDAVTEVCAGTPIDEAACFDLLSSLIGKSLVVSDLEHDDRYRMLDTVKSFSRERLLEAGEADRLARRHAEYFEALARQADAMYRRMPTRAWLEALEPDRDNFRAGLEWALDQRRDVVLGAALAAATISFFNDYFPSEAMRWMLRALELLPKGAAPRVEGRLCLGLATGSHDLPSATGRAAGERAIEIFRTTMDQQSLAEALRGTAQIIGWYFRDERELADALACESIEIARTLGDPLQVALSLRTRGLTIDIADFTAKRAVLEESLELMRAHGNDRQIGSMLTWISELEFSAGDQARALEYGREAVRFGESSGSNELYATTTGNLANYACAVGDWATARQAAAEAIRITRRSRHRAALTQAVEVYAILAAEFGDFERAAQLAGFCDSRYGTLHAGRQADQSEAILHARLMTLLREQLDEAALQAAMRTGSLMNEEEALALTGSPIRQ